MHGYQSLRILLSMFLLQSMYNHMVGRAASFVSPFYSILLGQIQCLIFFKWKLFNCLKWNIIIHFIIGRAVSNIITDHGRKLLLKYFFLLKSLSVCHLSNSCNLVSLLAKPDIKRLSSKQKQFFILRVPDRNWQNIYKM